jgi:hypothetical protein
MAVWPSSLQEFVNAGGFSYEIGDTVIRTQMEIGPDKIRRRTTKSVDKITASIWVTPAQYTTLYNFYDVTVNGGTEAFDFTHPITGDTISVRFLNPPGFSPVGFETYEARINLEVLP